MNKFLWALQILLALHTVMGAIWKFKNSSKSIPSLKAIPRPAWLGLSVVEILAAILLVLPLAYPPAANLVTTGAGLILLEMLIFCALHVISRNKNHKQIIYWLVVAVICAFIAYERY